MSKGKVSERTYYQLNANSVEGTPSVLQTFHHPPLVMRQPHWHAQVEVNFIMRGWVHYRMADYDLRLVAGDMALFWGGLPHHMDDASTDPIYAGAHLPLVHFFRLRLPGEVQRRLIAGSTLLIKATDASDVANFPRWDRYNRSGDPLRAQQAVSELLLRLERVRFEPFQLVPRVKDDISPAQTAEQFSSRKISLMSAFIAEHFLDNIECNDIAAAAGLHPKYAMSQFKKSTGMTLNDYLNLMRLSYAQARLLNKDANILHVAMDSGFGSLSAFNKSFRKIAGMSPSDFRKQGTALVPQLFDKLVSAPKRGE